MHEMLYNKFKKTNTLKLPTSRFIEYLKNKLIEINSESYFYLK